MTTAKGWIPWSAAALVASVWGVTLLANPCDPLVKDVEQLARTHRLSETELVSDPDDDSWYGDMVARYESASLTKEEKERLWADFKTKMTPYGKPMGPMCGYAAMAYELEGIHSPSTGYTRVGLREYSYRLEETTGPGHTVVLSLYCRTERLDEFIPRTTSPRP